MTRELSVDYYQELKEIFGQEIDDRYLYVQADISKNQSREKLLTEIKKKYDRIDVLVNNAGVAPKIRMDILETTEESYDWVMSVNLKGPYFLTQTISNWMIDLKDEKLNAYEPYIINISSIAGFTGIGSNIAYCASKAGLINMTKTMARALAPKIRVNCIAPGLMMTNMTKDWHEFHDAAIKKSPLGKEATPEDVAKTAIALARDLILVNGECIKVDGGQSLNQ